MAITADQVNRLETMLHNIHEHSRNTDANISWLMCHMEIIMTDLSKLTSAQSHLADEVMALKAVADKAVSTLADLSTQVKSLTDLIATLQGSGPADQATIDQLTVQSQAITAQVDAAMAEISAAIPVPAPTPTP